LLIAGDALRGLASG